MVGDLKRAGGKRDRKNPVRRLRFRIRREDVLSLSNGQLPGGEVLKLWEYAFIK